MSQFVPSKASKRPLTTGMSVVIFIGSLRLGGAEKNVVGLIELLKFDHRMAICLLGDQNAIDYCLSDEVVVEGLSLSSKSRNLFYRLAATLRRVYKMRQAIKRYQPKVVLAFLPQTNILTIIASLGIKTRLVVCERNNPSYQKIGLWGLIRPLAYRWSDHIAVNSFVALSYFSKKGLSRKITYTRNFIYPAQTKPLEAKSPRIILCIGRAEKQKGYDVLLDAFAMSDAFRCGWRLRIIGDGSEMKSLKSRARVLGLGQAVLWEGKVQPTSKHFFDADFFVLASRYEGTPNALLESLVHGLPFLVSDALSQEVEGLRLQNCGRLAKSESAEDFREKIDSLCGDPDALLKMSISCREKASEFCAFDYKKEWNRVLRIDSSGKSLP